MSEARFTKKQESAIKAFQKAYDKFEELGLRAHAAVDTLYVIRKQDWETYEADGSTTYDVSATEFLNYADDNNMPTIRLGYIEGVGD